MIKVSVFDKPTQIHVRAVDYLLQHSGTISCDNGLEDPAEHILAILAVAFEVGIAEVEYVLERKNGS